MAIQHRRGAYSDFDPTKMVEGEFAVVKTGDPNTEDGDAVYISTASGTAKRVALYQDITHIDLELDSATGTLYVTVNGIRQGNGVVIT